MKIVLNSLGKALILSLYSCIHFHLGAQDVSLNQTYSFEKLSQKSLNILATLQPSSAREVGDTTFTVYKGGSVDFQIYFINSDQYDNIFNPSPTGIFINKKHFLFFCGIEMAIRQNFSNVLQFYEFSSLARRYLMLASFREDCIGDGCRYRCYNVFDITDKENITQLSFSSLFEGYETFGDFNSDGILDFVRAAPKPPKGFPEGKPVVHYLITAHTIVAPGKHSQLKNKQGQPYYLYVMGDEEVRNFNILRADWFFSVKDTAGQAIGKKPYFGKSYISFNPYYRHLYDPDGVRIEKNRWSLQVSELSDLESAKEQCRRIQDQDLDDVFIMIDQYGGDIKFQIFIGNFINKELAVKQRNDLASKGISGKLFDLKNGY